MPINQTDRELRSNRLLGALEPASRNRIDPHLEPIEFKLGDMVCDAGGLLKHAYFPQGSVLSLLTVLENGAAIEKIYSPAPPNHHRRRATATLITGLHLLSISWVALE